MLPSEYVDVVALGPISAEPAFAVAKTGVASVAALTRLPDVEADKLDP